MRCYISTSIFALGCTVIFAPDCAVDVVLDGRGAPGEACGVAGSRRRGRQPQPLAELLRGPAAESRA